MAAIAILHGPNLNLLGQREPEHYGYKTLADIHGELANRANTLGHELSFYQSNAEHELINTIQQTTADVLIINPAAYTHTSIAIRDALLAVAIPFIEVHLSNIDARESFRRRSLLADIAIGRIQGFADFSYHLAVQAADHYLKNPRRIVK